MKNSRSKSPSPTRSFSSLFGPSPATVSGVVTPALPNFTNTDEFIEREMDINRLKMIISDKLRSILIDHARTHCYSDQARNPSDYEKTLDNLLDLMNERFDPDEEENYTSDMANENTYILMFFYLEQFLEEYLESTPEILTKTSLVLLLLASFSFANKILNDDTFTIPELLKATSLNYLRPADVSSYIDSFSIMSLELSSCYVSKERFDAYKTNFLNYQSQYGGTEIIELPATLRP